MYDLSSISPPSSSRYVDECSDFRKRIATQPTSGVISSTSGSNLKNGNTPTSSPLRLVTNRIHFASSLGVPFLRKDDGSRPNCRQISRVREVSA